MLFNTNSAADLGLHKMKNLIIDISGKVLNYDLALFDAIEKEATAASFKLLVPGKGLVSLIPKRFQHSEIIFKRVVKVAEGLLNYAAICLKMARYKPEVVHLQWLPFMEIVGWEIPILRCLRSLSPNTKFVLTIHNIYPHNMSDEGKRAYNVRFRKACALFDAFIVHTKISKEDVIREFGLSDDHVYVCCHGVFEPKGITLNSERRKGGKLHILQFGGQSYYKGTDLLVNAICGLDEGRKDKIETRIVGGINQGFLDELKGKDSKSIITWKPFFLSDNELFQEINAADLIVLPYRAISQSGVLLLSIFFEKMIICSDLPSFMETMQGNEDENLDQSLFFKSEEVGSLRELLVRYIDGDIDEDAVCNRVQHLKQLYSWHNSAKETLNLYKSL